MTKAPAICLLPFNGQSHMAEPTRGDGGHYAGCTHLFVPGKKQRSKNELVKRISKDFEEVANIKPESLNILFHDVAKEDWGVRGVLASEPLLK